MAIKFEDKDGNFLHLANGEIDPDNFPPSEHFPKGWRWRLITVEEENILCPPSKGVPQKNKFDHLIEAIEEILEKEVKIPKGKLTAIFQEKRGGK